MLYVLRVLPEIKSALPEEDHQHSEAFRKYGERLVLCYQVKKSIQACSLRAERRKEPTDGELSTGCGLRPTTTPAPIVSRQ